MVDRYGTSPSVTRSPRNPGNVHASGMSFLGGGRHLQDPAPRTQGMWGRDALGDTPWSPRAEMEWQTSLCVFPGLSKHAERRERGGLTRHLQSLLLPWNAVLGSALSHAQHHEDEQVDRNPSSQPPQSENQHTSWAFPVRSKFRCPWH